MALGVALGEISWLERAKLPDVWIRSLRHTAASVLAALVRPARLSDDPAATERLDAAVAVLCGAAHLCEIPREAVTDRSHVC